MTIKVVDAKSWSDLEGRSLEEANPPKLLHCIYCGRTWRGIVWALYILATRATCIDYSKRVYASFVDGRSAPGQ